MRKVQPSRRESILVAPGKSLSQCIRIRRSTGNFRIAQRVLLPALGESLCYMDAESGRRLHLLETVVGLNRHHLRVRVDLADDRERSSTDFVVYAPEILATHTPAKKQHTPYEEHCRGHAETRRVKWILRKYRRHSEHGCQANREAGQQETESQGLVAEARDRVHRVLDPA